MGRLAELAIADNLLSAVKGGDRDAARRLYDKVAAPAYTLARRLVGVTVAEDVLQESMLKMYGALDRYRGDAPFGAWLRRIVVTESLMQLRSPWRRARVLWDELSQDDADLTTAADPAVAIDAERALRRLTPTARAVLWLHAVEGYSHAEIGAQFGRSESFSKTQLARALRRLRPDETTPWLMQNPPNS